MPPSLLCSFGCRDFGTPALWAAFQYVAVVQQAIEHGADGGHVGE
jgi:hypothetical protein